MEINKILFEQTAEKKGIEKSFDELDVNSDGVINEKDEILAPGNDIKNVIENLLKPDEEEKIILLNNENTAVNKSGAQSKGPQYDPTYRSTGIEKDTSASTFEQDITNSKGTVYLVMGNLPLCGPCKKLSREIQNNADALKDVCQIYNINWNNPENTELCRSISKKLNGGAAFPVVVKFVDGEPVEVIRNYNPNNQATVVKEMIAKAEGVPDKTVTELTAKDTVSTAAKTSSNNSKNKYGITQTNTTVFENDITNSKGTVYLVMGSQTGCPHCVNLEKEIQSRLSELESVAQVYSIDWNGNRSKCWELYKQVAGNVSHADFPIILKFVDGKLVEEIPSPRSPKTAVQNMIDKAEGTPDTKTQQDTTNEETTTKSSSEIKKTSSESNTNMEKLKLDTRAKQLEKLQKEQLSLNLQQKTIQEELEELQKKIEEKQERMEELRKKIENAEPGENISSLRTELENLSLEVTNLSNDFDAKKLSLNLIENKIKTNSQTLQTVKLSVENTEKLISELKTSETNDDEAAATAVSDDGIDWSALYIEGKGVNISNFVNLLDTSGDKIVDKNEIQKLYDSGTDEQKAVLEKFFDFNKKGKVVNIDDITHLMKRGNYHNPLFEALAFQDTNGDGFLSDFEIGEIKEKLEKQANADREAAKQGYKAQNLLAPKTKGMLIYAGLGNTVQLSNSSYAFTQTTVNGKKVYIGFTQARSQYLSITEDEMKILQEYMNPENAKQYIGSDPKQLDPVWKALGAVEVKPGETVTLSNGETYTNSKGSRPTRVFVNSAGEICSYMINEQCSQCGKSFYALYLGIRDMMEGKEVQFKRDLSDKWV